MGKAKTKPLYSLEFQPSVTVGKGPHNAPVIAAELQRIERERGGLRPSDVVAEAAKRTSPLHRYFDWSDTVAARKWRDQQARSLIASVRVVITDAPTREPIRAFMHVPSPGMAQRYGSTADVLSDPEQREIVLARALQELRSFKERYADLKELADVFAAADRVSVR